MGSLYEVVSFYKAMEVLEITSGAYLIYSCYSLKLHFSPTRQKYNFIFAFYKKKYRWQNRKYKKYITSIWQTFLRKKDVLGLICFRAESCCMLDLTFYSGFIETKNWVNIRSNILDVINNYSRYIDISNIYHHSFFNITTR